MANSQPAAILKFARPRSWLRTCRTMCCFSPGIMPMKCFRRQYRRRLRPEPRQGRHGHPLAHCQGRDPLLHRHRRPWRRRGLIQNVAPGARAHPRLRPPPSWPWCAGAWETRLNTVLSFEVPNADYMLEDLSSVWDVMIYEHCNQFTELSLQMLFATVRLRGHRLCAPACGNQTLTVDARPRLGEAGPRTQ